MTIELEAFKKAAVKRAAENLLSKRPPKRRRELSRFRALRVILKNPGDKDEELTPFAPTKPTTWDTPHGKAAIVPDWKTPIEVKSTKRKQTIQDCTSPLPLEFQMRPSPPPTQGLTWTSSHGSQGGTRFTLGGGLGTSATISTTTNTTTTTAATSVGAAYSYGKISSGDFVAKENQPNRPVAEYRPTKPVVKKSYSTATGITSSKNKDGQPLGLRYRDPELERFKLARLQAQNSSIHPPVQSSSVRRHSSTYQPEDPSIQRQIYEHVKTICQREEQETGQKVSTNRLRAITESVRKNYTARTTSSRTASSTSTDNDEEKWMMKKTQRSAEDTQVRRHPEPNPAATKPTSPPLSADRQALMKKIYAQAQVICDEQERKHGPLTQAQVARIIGQVTSRHYNSPSKAEVLKQQKEAAPQISSPSNDVQPRRPSATGSTATSSGGSRHHRRMLPKRTSPSTQGDATESPEGSPTTVSTNDKKEQEETNTTQKDSALRQEQNRIFHRWADGLKKFQVSGPFFSIRDQSAQMQDLLCWLRNGIVSPEWLARNHVALDCHPVGWPAYFDHSIIVFSLKTLPRGYLVGATMYQNNHRHRNKRHDYERICHAMMEFGPATPEEKRPSRVTRRWTDWGFKDAHCVFNQMMLRLNQIDMTRPMYEFVNAAALENALGTIVHGRDLEHLTCLFTETPTWLV